MRGARHRRRHHAIEPRIAAAVERTRRAEQQASQGRRVETLGRLTGGVAHDFNQLLGVISNSAHLMRRQTAALFQAQAQRCEVGLSGIAMPGAMDGVMPARVLRRRWRLLAVAAGGADQRRRHPDAAGR